jgi:hypothetical protein
MGSGIRDGKKSDPESGKISRIRNIANISFCVFSSYYLMVYLRGASKIKLKKANKKVKGMRSQNRRN